MPAATGKEKRSYKTRQPAEIIFGANGREGWPLPKLAKERANRPPAVLNAWTEQPHNPLPFFRVPRRDRTGELGAIKFVWLDVWDAWLASLDAPPKPKRGRPRKNGGAV